VDSRRVVVPRVPEASPLPPAPESAPPSVRRHSMPRALQNNIRDRSLTSSSSTGAPGGRQSQDLDALLNSLQVDSRTVPVTHQQQQPAPAAHQHQHQHHAPAAGGAGMPSMRAPGSGGAPMGAPAAATPKGSCATCQRPIQGPMMQALGGTYHPNCFVCGNCGESLGSGSFFQTDGRPTCSRCYQVHTTAHDTIRHTRARAAAHATHMTAHALTRVLFHHPKGPVLRAVCALQPGDPGPVHQRPQQAVARQLLHLRPVPQALRHRSLL
jgi:hypothetical protein